MVVTGGEASLELAEEDVDEDYAELDAAARILVLWGRRPDQRGRFRSHMPNDALTRLQALLAGY